LLNRSRQRESFAKRRSLAHFDDQARNPSRGRFLTQFTKQLSQLLFTVMVYDGGSSQGGRRIHPHVEGTVSHKAETARRIFQLARRNTKIKEDAADRANAEFIENIACVSEICLPHNDAATEMCQPLRHVLDCVRVLIESQNLGAAFQ